MLRILLPATALAVTVMGVAVPNASAASTCQQDGVATLCANAMSQQDVVAIGYQVTQFDGPGAYTLYYVSDTTGASSDPRNIGPLGYQGTVSGTMYAALDDCYEVHLDSASGTSLVAGPVCG